MKQFKVVPEIVGIDTAKEFCEEFKVGSGDLILINRFMYDKYFAGAADGATVIDVYDYGSGEPSDTMVEKIYAKIKDVSYDRVIAVGGGTIIDVAKLFALKNVSPVVDLFEKKLEIVRDKKLVIVPTTCGTGSEVTNISILELTVRNTKFGLAVPELYADQAVLIPELLEGLPFRVFAASSIDALIHSIESFTSPKANEFTKMYSRSAMKTIITAYKDIAQNGEEAVKAHLGEILLASTYAGIAFGNAGCAAVHAMSYPLGAAYHVAHGEANYAMFTGVYKTYQKLDPNGGIEELNEYLARLLECRRPQVYEELDRLLTHLMPKKRLRDYGVKPEELESFTETVMTKQGRLMANNYTELSRADVRKIYEELY